MDETPVVEKNAVKAASWPTPQDYNEAMQNPGHAFSDPELALAEAACDRLGIPRPSTGMFASVYKLSHEESIWAVRCFLRNFEDQHQRYGIIGEKLQAYQFPFTMEFKFEPEGIRVGKSWFPVLKMEWCSGELISDWVSRHLDDAEAIAALAADFKQVLETMSKAGIAHGDLQHGNLLVENGEIKLVDYDGMYLPELAALGTHELGHRNYQHPLRDASAYNAKLDNFSGWLIYLSLICLSIDPSIWQNLNGGDECLIFRHADLVEPQTSPAFRLLSRHPNAEIRLAAWILRKLLDCKADDVWDFASAPASMQELLEYCGRPDLDENMTVPEWMSLDEFQELLASAASPQGGLDSMVEHPAEVLFEDSLLLGEQEPVSEVDFNEPDVWRFASGIAHLVEPEYCARDSLFTFQVLEAYFQKKVASFNKHEAPLFWMLSFLLVVIAFACLAVALQFGLSSPLAVYVGLMGCPGFLGLAAFSVPASVLGRLRRRLKEAGLALKRNPPQKIRLTYCNRGVLDFVVVAANAKFSNDISAEADNTIHKLGKQREFMAFVHNGELLALVDNRRLLLILGRLKVPLLKQLG